MGELVDERLDLRVGRHVLADRDPAGLHLVVAATLAADRLELYERADLAAERDQAGQHRREVLAGELTQGRVKRHWRRRRRQRLYLFTVKDRAELETGVWPLSGIRAGVLPLFQLLARRADRDPDADRPLTALYAVAELQPGAKPRNTGGVEDAAWRSAAGW